MKIRFLFPKHAFNSHRVDLVRRLTPLALKEIKDVKRIMAADNEEIASFYEGFLETKDEQEAITTKLNIIAERLSDNPYFVKQSSEECLTYLIEDGDMCDDNFAYYDK
jgi:hypothetical protein